MYANSEAVLGLTTFLHAYTKSYAVTESPLDHFAFFLKLIVSVLPPLLFFGKDLAIAGSALSSLFKVYNPQKLELLYHQKQHL